MTPTYWKISYVPVEGHPRYFVAEVSQPVGRSEVIAAAIGVMIQRGGRAPISVTPLHRRPKGASPVKLAVGRDAN
jgi:hypothetical protein